MTAVAARLWIEAHDYAAALLRGGEEPWDRPAEIGQFCAETARLLHADRLLLPLAPLIARHAAPGDDAAERLDAAVADGAILADVGAALASLDACGMLERIVPLLPGPAMAAGKNADADALDVAAMALGDLVRAIGAHRPAAIALAETDPAGVAAASSLFRIAGHFEIPVALLGPGDHPLAAICFPTAGEPAAPDGKGDGCRVTIDGIEARGAPKAHHLLLAVERHQSPERLLAAIARLGQAA